MSGKSIYRTRVIRLYPTPEQEERLSQWVGTVRFVYNLALEQRLEWWRPGRRFDFVSQGREITELRKAEPWLADVPRDCLDQALRDLDRGFQSWWAGRGRPPGFRRLGANDSARFPKPVHFAVRRTGARSGFVRLPKMGEVRARLNALPSGQPKNLTVFRRAGHWFAALLLERQEQVGDQIQSMVGLDRGVRVFAAMSNGDMVRGPGVGQKASAALARAQRNAARKIKGSANRRKARARVARLFARVADARKDFIHKASTDIAKSHGVVVLEDLRIGNMTRSAKGTAEKPGRNVRQKAGLNRSILDQGWGMFHRLLAYKLAERGGQLILVPAKDTSRTCAACGVVDKESRKAERFQCTACGHEADADINAAINILSRGRASVQPVEASPSRAAREAGTSGRAA